MYKIVALSAALLVSGGVASATPINIDFETGFSGNVTPVGDPYTIGGVTFTRGEDQNVVKTGAPEDGFVPSDTITDGLFGTFFLTDDFVSNTNVDLSLTFDAPAVTDLKFYIGDIDGSGDQEETFTATANLLGGGVSSLSFSASAAEAGDSIATLFDFGNAYIVSVDIAGSTPGNFRNIGWGIDNISATPVPLPAAAWMLLASIGGLAAVARRKASGSV